MLRNFIFLALAVALYTVPAAADDWKDCGNDSQDVSIKGCTAFLGREGQAAPSRARAYTNRGAAYLAKGELDRAIADYNHAIELDPKFAIAYNGRGSAYKDRGDLDRAIADYNRAIELDPKYADAYNSRGIAFEAKSDMDKAIA
jgi:tetratricopeptide (TPR) repeat protein